MGMACIFYVWFDGNLGWSKKYFFPNLGTLCTGAEAQLPSIIAFTYFGRRFEIVIPWKRCKMAEASHILQLNYDEGYALAQLLNFLPFTSFMSMANDITVIKPLFSLCALLHCQIKPQIKLCNTDIVLSLVGWDLPTLTLQ